MVLVSFFVWGGGGGESWKQAAEQQRKTRTAEWNWLQRFSTKPETKQKLHSAMRCNATQRAYYRDTLCRRGAFRGVRSIDRYCVSRSNQQERRASVLDLEASIRRHREQQEESSSLFRIDRSIGVGVFYLLIKPGTRSAARSRSRASGISLRPPLVGKEGPDRARVQVRLVPAQNHRYPVEVVVAPGRGWSRRPGQRPGRSPEGVGGRSPSGSVVFGIVFVLAARLLGGAALFGPLRYPDSSQGREALEEEAGRFAVVVAKAEPTVGPPGTIVLGGGRPRKNVR
mmetsp:Transcript_20751/g.43460  ORF Transcript_20751/g.43460 Transcript_20751/m.43460 type:complete len:284 (-) Transcript_20751:716-1567(-)